VNGFRDVDKFEPATRLQTIKSIGCSRLADVFLERVENFWDNVVCQSPTGQLPGIDRVEYRRRVVVTFRIRISRGENNI
jgi:hypothetical protein